MHEQVITISPDGTMETLRQKKGQGIDLREFGEIEMKRVSEVSLDEENQKYYVQFLDGALEGRILTVALFDFIQTGAEEYKPDLNPAMFDFYEDGVEAEIKALNALSLGRVCRSTARRLCPITRIYTGQA